MAKKKKSSFRSKYNVECPNCLKPAQQTGEQVFCEFCDAVFTHKKAGGYHLRKSGSMHRIEKRLSALEGDRPGSDKNGQGQGIIGIISNILFGDGENDDILPP